MKFLAFNSSPLLFFIDHLNEFPIQPNPNYNIDSKLQLTNYKIQMNSPGKDQLFGMGSPRKTIVSPQKNKKIDIEKNQLSTL